ncbi:hypothetical protein KO317_03670 [Candidatus Micrarchaeota archaeon]|nr:hypothetical protein [Candidatus Micrarchaeota archaeon]
MKKKKTKKTDKIFVLVIIIISILAITVIGIKKTEDLNKEIPLIENNTKIELSRCLEGEEKECITEYNCDGTQYCKNGKWTNCYKNKVVCIPSKEYTCALTPCLSGTKVCNDCGTGWEKCK